MIRFIAAFCTALLAFVPANRADEPLQVPPPAQTAQETPSRLDALFQDLKHERNEQAARRIAARIGEAWNTPGSATAALLMQWANEAIKEKKVSVALDFLDQLVLLYPDYAEAWNRRATLHFTMNDYARAMADISRTLELEPRHFGALAGMARILQATGRREQALGAYERVLDVYPMLRSAQKAVAELSDELAGQGI
ncbi:tetratricopeptide repeat protein [Nitratireductor pacificus]|uniref:Uncharacterized protein n=1 Tax=Nitratireductor pacificus pht-3B TaxID=391937 RepID=K2M9B9_9HYPH|nr:tetratricopeptide repeat protein [Nitratireductor pacificus]EKF18711.1 hypothetical protein NA2_11025 [Nitratireductor pacificus pht-3B]